MSFGRMLGYSVVAMFALAPFYWWITGKLSYYNNIGDFLIGPIVCWAIAGWLAYLMAAAVRSSKARKIREAIEAEALALRRERESAEIKEILDAPLTEIKPSKALLKESERAFASIQAELKEIQTVGYSAGTKGVSVHVSKNVTLRSSASRGHPVKALVTVAKGELVITDKRVIFAGDKKSFALLLADLISTTDYTNGFGFSDSKSTYTLVTADDHSHAIFGTVLNKVLRG